MIIKGSNLTFLKKKAEERKKEKTESASNFGGRYSLRTV